MTQIKWAGSNLYALTQTFDRSDPYTKGLRPMVMLWEQPEEGKDVSSVYFCNASEIDKCDKLIQLCQINRLIETSYPSSYPTSSLDSDDTHTTTDKPPEFMLGNNNIHHCLRVWYSDEENCGRFPSNRTNPSLVFDPSVQRDFGIAHTYLPTFVCYLSMTYPQRSLENEFHNIILHLLCKTTDFAFAYIHPTVACENTYPENRIQTIQNASKYDQITPHKTVQATVTATPSTNHLYKFLIVIELTFTFDFVDKEDNTTKQAQQQIRISNKFDLNNPNDPPTISVSRGTTCPRIPPMKLGSTARNIFAKVANTWHQPNGTSTTTNDDTNENNTNTNTVSAVFTPANVSVAAGLSVATAAVLVGTLAGGRSRPKKHQPKGTHAYKHTRTQAHTHKRARKHKHTTVAWNRMRHWLRRESRKHKGI